MNHSQQVIQLFIRAALCSAVLICCSAFLFPSSAQVEVINFEDNWGNAGFNLINHDNNSVEIVFSLSTMQLVDMEINGEAMKEINVPGIFLPNNAGAPNLPGTGRYIAIPQGSWADLEVMEYRTEVFSNLNIAPAFEIPREDDDSPLVYEKDLSIFNTDACYPTESVILSEPHKMRGVDVVIVGITPFQYNPVSRELLVYKDLRIRVNFHGGNGHLGEDALRNRWWEPVLKQHLMNYTSLPPVDFNRVPVSDEDNVEYIIIVPDDNAFIAWADTLKRWRNEQGIITGITTLTEIGGNNSTQIENYINNAYNNWTIRPVAFLLLSDYQSSGDTYGITSPMYNGYCVSDNIYADEDGDDLPDLIHGRICAQNNGHLQTMINKMLTYERSPYTNTGFYDHPVIAGGWQSSRWFILCCEVVYGFLDNILGKNPVREYAIYSGTPGSQWSTNVNTYMIVDYFGPSGLGYIPATPEHLTDWGGNADRINADINSGAFIVQHRDHGAIDGWGEPGYHIPDLGALNNNMYPYVFSHNCLTGMYNYGGSCFAEAIHRIDHGALGITAATEVSYSFVNDVFVWGTYDSMWPNFDPGYGMDPVGQSNLRPGVGLMSGKYYLEASGWPYNPDDKEVTYHLFHHHGDAFMTLYSQVPQNLNVIHANNIAAGATSFAVTADAGSLIGLSINSQVIGSAEGTGGSVTIPISPPPQAGQVMRVTVTKANYYRYIADVPVGAITPITLTSFSAAVNGNDVEIGWNTTSEINCYGWYVERSQDGVIFDVISELILGHGSSSETHQYSFVDQLAIAGRTYNYRLKQVDNGGVFTYSDPITITFSRSDVSTYRLAQNYPNPFNPITTLTFDLPEATAVTLKIYDATGRLSATLLDEWRELGSHEVSFNAAELAAGVYVYRLNAGDFTASAKMVLMK
ncbi:MAG: C25 family cysteine peptidase [bacterium]